MYKRQGYRCSLAALRSSVQAIAEECAIQIPDQCISVSNRTSTAGADSNRIRFDFRRGAYLIMYKGEAGEARQLSKGLEVPRTDYIGNVLRGDAYSQAKAQVLIKARLQWNTLDRSGAPRFPADDGVPQPRPWGGLQPA